MMWTQRWSTGAAVVAVGLMIAPGADAGWLGFGDLAAQPRPGVTLAQSSSDSARLNQLEQTIRNLTGQIEILQHQLDELTRQLAKTQADNEFRFGELEQRGSGAKPDAAAAAAPEAAPADAGIAGAEPAPAESAVAAAEPAPATEQPLGAPPQPLGTLALPVPETAASGQQPLDLSALARGDGGQADAGGPAAVAEQPPEVMAPSGDPVADYKAAYQLFLSGQYAPAEKAFRQFLDAYPGDPRAGEAIYWLGQSLFSRGMYTEAAREFVSGHKLYPKSALAADTMLQLGRSLAGIPERDTACQVFAAALKQYPTMSNALRQRVITEQANAGCKGG